MIYLIIDTETTGLPNKGPLEEQPNIIEFACLRYDSEDPSNIVETTFLVKPPIPLPAKITEITGLTDDDLADQPSFAQRVTDILACFEGAHYAIAHNMAFDWGMLSNDLKRYAPDKVESFKPPALVCSMNHYKGLFTKRPKLQDLYAHFIGEPLAQTHRALDDVRALHAALIAAKFYE